MRLEHEACSAHVAQLTRSVFRIVCFTTCLVACSSAPTPTSPPPSASTQAAPKAARILVLGDVQLASPFKADSSLTTWKTGKLDTTAFAARLGEALRDTSPTQIIQTGDFVDLNEGAVLDVRNADGAPLFESKQVMREWEPMLALLPKEPRFYPVVGNHERYGELKVTAMLLPDGDHVEMKGLKMVRGVSSSEAHDQMLAHFPHLKGEAQFYGATGSYYVPFDRFCFLSIDGVDFDGDRGLFKFVGDKLTECNAAKKTPIVSDHYPVFSGRPKAEDDSLELHAYRAELIALFSQHRVALVLTGHEHFYLRYLDAGRKLAGYSDELPGRPVYMTVSDFANPYSRKLERIDPALVGDGFRYFHGTHYAQITLDENGVNVVVRGYQPDSASWKEIDSFHVPD